MKDDNDLNEILGQARQGLREQSTRPEGSSLFTIPNTSSKESTRAAGGKGFQDSSGAKRPGATKLRAEYSLGSSRPMNTRIGRNRGSVTADW